LKKIIKQEGLEIKNRQFYNASTIKDNINDPIERKKIIDYAIMDGDDALALFDLMIGPLFYLTQSIPKPLQTMVESASGGQLNSLLVRNYLQDGYSIPLGDQGNRFEGAISDSWPGIYHNTWKVDVASLYPSIILQYDIFPKRKDPRGYIRYILEYFRSQRLENKRLAKDSGKRQYKDLSEVGKVIANSIYGFYNAPRLNFNYPEGAEQVTRRGREILNTAIKWACDKDYDDIKKAV
jgi:DNA polymerase elongation subunit (family B)